MKIKNLNSYITNVLTKAKRAELRSGIASAVSSAESIRKGIKRVPNADEINKLITEGAKQPLHHYVFCSHNIPYWRTCKKCGRNRVSAERNAKMILSKCESFIDVLK